MAIMYRYYNLQAEVAFHYHKFILSVKSEQFYFFATIYVALANVRFGS